MNEMIYLYDGSFHGFLCCIFESYAKKESPTAIACDEALSFTLFPTRNIATDSGHALRVLREGPGFLRNSSDETLHPVFSAVRHLNGEAHLLKGFVRFSELGGVLGGEIEPKNRVLPLLRSHFCARYQNEKFFIYDRTHHEALFYAAGRAVIRPLADFQMAPPDETEAHYRLLWKRFYDTIAIRERENPQLRMTHMPKRYWGTMTEFQPPEHFRAQSSFADVPAPGVPDGTPAPATPPAPGLSAPVSAP